MAVIAEPSVARGADVPVVGQDLSPIDEFIRARGMARARYVRLITCLSAVAIDVAMTCLSFLLIAAFTLRDQDTILMGLTSIVLVVVNFYTRAYGFSAMQSLQIGAMRVFHGWLVTIAVVLLLVYTGKASASFSRSVFLPTAMLAPVLLFFGRAALVTVVRRRLSKLFISEILLEDGVAVNVPDTIDHASAAALDLRPDPNDPIRLHNFSCLSQHYSRIVVACPAERRGAWALYLQAVACNGELVVHELDGIGVGANPLRPKLATVKVAVGPLDLPDRVLKRAFDLAITVPAIIVLSPLLLLVALAVKFDSRGPVLFQQQRMGRYNRLFHVYKFRSMRQESSDALGVRSATRDDDRITRVGRIIRATSLDELPQLFNVLNGDMALVGPRPHALGSRAGDDLFWHVDDRYWLRHSIKPGITGLAQVRGFRGATDVRDDLSNRLHHDLEYVHNWSIGRDLFILLRTLLVLVHRKAY